MHQRLTSFSCAYPCKEQAGIREGRRAIVFYSRRLIFRSEQRRILVGFVSPKCPRAPALMLRRIAARRERRCSYSRSALRCVSKHEGACDGSSSSFETRARRFQVAARFGMRAPQDEDEHRVTTAHDVKQPFSFPRPHCCVRALPLCFTHPLEGWAERRETFGCCASAPVGRARNAARQAPSEAPCVP
jgi:hypothetical protein